VVKKASKSGPKTSTKRAKSSSTTRTRKRPSTKTRKPATPSAVETTSKAPTTTKKRLKKTRLSEENLNMFRQLLLDKRAQLLGDVNHMQQHVFRNNRQDAAGDLSSMPIHMADIGSDNYEQELTLGLLENEQQVIRDIDEALARIEDRTYGLCRATGKIISKARLKARPWAKYCIDYARLLEKGLVAPNDANES